MNIELSKLSEIVIRCDSGRQGKAALACNELRRGLRQLLPSTSILAEPAAATDGALQVELSAGPAASEGYVISATPTGIMLAGDGERGLLHAVFDFLERQGVVYGLDGELYPIDRVTRLKVPPPDGAWQGRPQFANRGLQPWPDFLNCITTFNEADLRAYLEAMLRMRFNTLGIHVYGQSHKWAEPWLSFEYGGVGHAAFADTSATDRWGYLPQRTSRFGMGAAQYFDDEIFGADATRYAAGPWETAERSQAVWGAMFRYAEELGIKMGVGFELYQLPEEIVKAAPPQTRTKLEHSIKFPGDIDFHISFNRVDPSSRAAKYILETRLAQLLETYPSVAYVKLWEDEFTNWISQQEAIDTPLEPFLQAHDFLRRHAPGVQLVIAGWGGVVRNFERFHRALPGDIVFAALSDQFGWDPIHENFGKLEDRERWPIPWLEDDPSMWFPQIHASRFEKDLALAQDYGCSGMIGIHWRHRIVDPVASYMARRSWDADYDAAEHYHNYARTQASGERAERFGNWLHATDVNRHMVETWTGEIRDDGHYESQEYSGDYYEVFLTRAYGVDEDALRQQAATADALTAIATDAPPGTLEAERLDYWQGQVGFLPPYLKAWRYGRQLEDKFDRLFKQRHTGEAVDSEVVYSEAIPLWVQVLENTREAVLAFQRTVATRNDLGMLVSIHNKLVRIAAFRMEHSLLEFIDELPADAQRALAQAVAPDAELRAAVIVPTRPTRLNAGESTIITAIAPGSSEVARVDLLLRAVGSSAWRAKPMTLVGRRTYSTEISMPAGAADGIEYRVRAEFAATPAPAVESAPVEGSYIITR